MPSSICSQCLKKLLGNNAFRKQCLSSEFQLKKLKHDYTEKKLLKEIEDRLDAEEIDSVGLDDNEIEFIEYIDENCESDSNDDKSETEAKTGIVDDNLHQYEEFSIELVKDDDTEYENSYDEYDEDPGNDIEAIHSGGEAANITVEDAATSTNKNNFMKVLQFDDNASSSVTKHGRRMCPICGKLVVNLKPHISTHDEIGKRRKPYKCSYCGKEYLQRAQFDGHVNKEHTGEKPFHCDQCNKSFHGRPSLRMHKIQHSKDRRFVCEFCDKSYLYAHHLSHHRYTHTQKRLFSCKQCEYTNVHQDNLKRHIISKHTKQNEKPYQCSFCSRPFNGRSNLQRHIKLLHKQS